MIVSVNATVPDFLLNAAAYLRKVMEGEQVCLVQEGKVQIRITPEGAPAADEAAGAAMAQNRILQARQLKAQLSAKYSEDDWTPRDYLEAGRRG
jgi:antitoxin (DNA-binding transcriptional repressor) of toxin-antitoxin stability system